MTLASMREALVGKVFLLLADATLAQLRAIYRFARRLLSGSGPRPPPHTH